MVLLAGCCLAVAFCASGSDAQYQRQRRQSAASYVGLRQRSASPRSPSSYDSSEERRSPYGEQPAYRPKSTRPRTRTSSKAGGAAGGGSPASYDERRGNYKQGRKPTLRVPKPEALAEDRRLLDEVRLFCISYNGRHRQGINPYFYSKK